ncbi:platelet glycoprotein Ib alpha chain [Thalassophryne amazonica]|uniref:platelet glycoprotein Ib alpha chain n=1 Tax=Thalassophryne amazonica TaxID=390379 RepID=UPI001471095A|nr:platelet glycoprotein Ib alpha chain [Thalassophryne amazonica]
MKLLKKQEHLCPRRNQQKARFYRLSCLTPCQSKHRHTELIAAGSAHSCLSTDTELITAGSVHSCLMSMTRRAPLVMRLFVVLAHVAMVTAVPGCLSDRDKDHQLQENCTAAGFSDVPPGFKPTTKVLLFPRNLFSSLSWVSFQVFTEIYEIDLTGNQVPEVIPSAVPVLHSLNVLRLGRNRLTSLPNGSFTACPSLTKLYLDNNAIESLSDRTFATLSKLKILDLSSNRIRVLPPLLLHPLLVIETLYLDNNKIAMMPDDWFGQKEEVPYLYLSANPWACSCDLTYLNYYIKEYEENVYVRNDSLIQNLAESVVCDSPKEHRGKPVSSLNESDLCLASNSREDANLLTQTQTDDDGGTTVPLLPTAAVHTSPPASTHDSSTTTAVTHQDTERVVTWSLQELFTSLIEWSHHSGSEVRGDTGPPVGSTAESIAEATPSPGGTSLPTGTDHVPTSRVGLLTMTPAAEVGVLTPASAAGVTSMLAPSTAVTAPDGGRRHVAVVGASGACTLVTMIMLVFWNRNMARKRRGRQRGEGVKLLVYNPRDKKEVQQEVTAGEAVMLYRSVLFVHREGEGRGGEQYHISLEPAGEGEKGRDEKRVYKKTIYRVLNQQEEVMEECPLAAGGGATSRRCYSVILREEREEAGEQREALDWVVGGWEVTGGRRRWEEGELRSSWGEWFAHYLPSMPWTVTAPSERGAAK